MKMKKTLNSGSVLQLDYTSMKNTIELAQGILRNVNKQFSNIKLDSNLLNTDIEKLLSQDLMSKIVPILIECAGDDDLLKTIYKCADNCIINDSRVNEEYFEDVNNRKDFIQTIIEVVKYQFTPFFPKVPTSLKQDAKEKEESQK